jgi:glycosyltransferase involved in cell wall biosynthesis
MERKIKIVRIINRFSIGGPTFNVTYLTRYLPDEYETILVGGVPERGETDSFHILRFNGIEPVIIPELSKAVNPMNDRKAYHKIKKIIEEFKPDIVHTHASKSGLIGRLAANSLNVPIVLHTFHGHVFHSYFGKLKTELVIRLERHLAKISTGIIAISETQKHELTKVYKIAPENKVEIVPLGFDLSSFVSSRKKNRDIIRQKLGLEDGEVAIALVGRLVPIKDHDFFLDVIQQLVKRTSRKIHVFIVGDGEERGRIERRVESLKQEGCKIVMTSWILDVAEFNGGMDIICLTSKNEGTPVSLIEAQATGLPVVSTDVGGVKDIVANGQAGFIVEKGDLSEYVAKLQILVENDALRENYGKFGQQYVLDYFNYNRLISNMDRYYKSLLNRVS